MINMKSVTLVLALGLVAPAAQAAVINETGQCVGMLARQVAELMRRYPEGGPALSSALLALMRSNPQLAQDVVCASAGASPAQRPAMASALVSAQSYFAQTGNSASAGFVARAMSFADPQTSIQIASLSGPSSQTPSQQQPQGAGGGNPGSGGSSYSPVVSGGVSGGATSPVR